MNTLRAFFVALLFFVTMAHAEPQSLDGLECPPGDLGDWHLNPKRSVANTVEWIKLPYTSFQQQCMTNSPYTVACAWVYKDTEGKPYGVVYVRDTPWGLTPAQKQHEMCHLLGWEHGPWYN